MLIDCNTCVARGRACPDCVVTMFLNRPSAAVDLDEDEQRAIEQLSDAGLVPPLRLVPLLRTPPVAEGSGRVVGPAAEAPPEAAAG
jgi:hypothetical protein